MRKGNRVLVTGACGQIGSELTMILRERYGNDNVVASDIKSPGSEELGQSGPFCILDVTNTEDVLSPVFQRYDI